MTEPGTGDLPNVHKQPADEQPADEQPADEQKPSESRRRLRVLPALAIASVLVAGGLLMAVGGMARLVGPAPPTPVLTAGPSATPGITPVPTPLPSTPTLGPSPSPFGLAAPRSAAV